jgi:hypothetical protein
MSHENLNPACPVARRGVAVVLSNPAVSLRTSP